MADYKKDEGITEEASAFGQRVKGAAKDAAGSITGNERLEREGERENAMGDARQEANDMFPNARAAAGAVGGTVGALLAAIAAIGTNVLLPGLGLVVAGPLAAGLAGAGAGSVTGGLIGALVGSGIPQERVKHYEEGIKQGGILMGVTPRSEEDARHFETRWQEHQGQHVLGTGVGATAGAV